MGSECSPTEVPFPPNMTRPCSCSMRHSRSRPPAYQILAEHSLALKSGGFHRICAGGRQPALVGDDADCVTAFLWPFENPHTGLRGRLRGTGRLIQGCLLPHTSTRRPRPRPPGSRLNPSAPRRGSSDVAKRRRRCSAVGYGQRWLCPSDRAQAVGWSGTGRSSGGRRRRPAHRAPLHG